MEKLRIYAKSSEGDKRYSVDFIFEDNRMAVKCDCPAGRFGKFCKHKFAFLKGNDSWLADEEQYDALNKIADWAQKSDYLDYIINMSKLQQVIDQAESEMKTMRNQMGKAMKQGVLHHSGI